MRTATSGPAVRKKAKRACESSVVMMCVSEEGSSSLMNCGSGSAEDSGVGSTRSGEGVRARTQGGVEDGMGVSWRVARAHSAAGGPGIAEGQRTNTRCI